MALELRRSGGFWGMVQMTRFTGKISRPQGGDVTYAYDARDELINETLAGSDISAVAVARTYDNASNMTGQCPQKAKAATAMPPAHWHSFWIGKKDQPGVRSVTLKWLPPIPVNVTGIDDLTTTVRDVGK